MIRLSPPSCLCGIVQLRSSCKVRAKQAPSSRRTSRSTDVRSNLLNRHHHNRSKTCQPGGRRHQAVCPGQRRRHDRIACFHQPTAVGPFADTQRAARCPRSEGQRLLERTVIVGPFARGRTQPPDLCPVFTHWLGKLRNDVPCLTEPGIQGSGHCPAACRR